MPALADFLIVAGAAVAAAALTLISGFGLGTLLMPVFAIVLGDVAVAIGATAVVHLANSLFRLLLVGRDADRGVVGRFGIPAIAGAFVGALALAWLGEARALASYEVGPVDGRVTVVKLVVGVLIVAFALIEGSRRVEQALGGRIGLTAGGAISGFFGGLSGHQGALRSVVLVKLGLDRDAYIGTSAACAALVDVTRLGVYFAGAALFTKDFGAAAEGNWWLIGAGCVAAFAGSAIGSRLVKKMTLSTVRAIVAALLLLTGVAMIAGVI